MDCASLIASCSVAVRSILNNENKLVALLEKCLVDLITPSLLESVAKRSKKYHERSQVRLGMGEWTESSDESSAESEAPKAKPPLGQQ